MNRKFSIALVMLLAVVGVGYVACAEMFPSGTWRYKMTVTVETPEGIKTGSAVREVYSSRPLVTLPDTSSSPQVKGEAVIIDLEDRGLLFGLIDWNSYREVYGAFPYPAPSSSAGIEYYNSLKIGTTAEVPQENWPRFVYFKEISNPLSVEQVNISHLDQNYGEGVRLKNIEVTITDEPMQNKINQVLPWLVNLKANIDGTSVTTSTNLSNTLHVGNFVRRGRK